ncbi:DHHC palmitoyltransferase-domain-containing protein [Tribonema minus]|uniref:Palmitoyltransferase n=1 Tax=Tribonema minus TaxID=303371 RepID=A0A835YRU2_9STRA|nr:DHHC palmitoyltransferase-domain-containing protein [Tribonema minus]
MSWNRPVGEAKQKPPCCGTTEGARLWCNVDCCGITCALVTWFLLTYAQYVVTRYIIRPWMGMSMFGVLHTLSFNCLAILCIVVHLRAMTTDPGAVSCRAEPPPKSPAAEIEAGEEGMLLDDSANVEEKRHKPARRWCHRCDAYKPERAHHCSVCRRCIVKMDHHCPWMNNCVGIGNHKFFLQFIGYTFLLCGYALVLIVFRFLTCVGVLGSLPGSDFGTCLEGSGMVLILVAEAVLFGMFTFCMALDQWEVLSSGQTQIDRLKGEQHATSADVHEVFGGGKRCRVDWLLPTRPVFCADAWEEVMGHRLRPDALCLEMKYYLPTEVARGGGGGGAAAAAAAPRTNAAPARAGIPASAKSSAAGAAFRAGQVRERKAPAPPPSATASGFEWERPPPASAAGGSGLAAAVASPRALHGTRYNL